MGLSLHLVAVALAAVGALAGPRVKREYLDLSPTEGEPCNGAEHEEYPHFPAEDKFGYLSCTPAGFPSALRHRLSHKLN